MRCTACTSTHVYTCSTTHKRHMNALIIAVERGKQKQEPNKLISQENAGLTSVFESTIAVDVIHVVSPDFTRQTIQCTMPHAATKVELRQDHGQAIKQELLRSLNS